MTCDDPKCRKPILPGESYMRSRTRYWHWRCGMLRVFRLGGREYRHRIGDR